MWLTNPVWIIILILLLVAIIAVIWIVRSGHTHLVLTATSSGIAWLLCGSNNRAAVLRHAGVVVLLILLLLGARWYTTGVAEQKAGDWLTSYNGSATTDIVGPIKADPGLTTSPSPSPSPSPSVSPSPVSEGTPAALVETAASLTTSTTTPSPKPNQTSSTGANTSATPTPSPTAAEQKRLDAQLRSIRDRIKHHGDVMAYFYVNYFVAIVMVMIAGLIVAVTLFFIAQNGWTATNSYVEAIFVTASMWAAFYGLFPPVFEQQKNIADNKALFLEYKGLESEVESYLVTYLTLKGEYKKPSEFINHVDTEMDRLGNIALGFDVTKINYQEAITLKPQANSNSNTNAASPPGKK
jgi:hypothetical protein